MCASRHRPGPKESLTEVDTSLRRAGQSPRQHNPPIKGNQSKEHKVNMSVHLETSMIPRLGGWPSVHLAGFVTGRFATRRRSCPAVNLATFTPRRDRNWAAPRVIVEYS